MAQGRAPNVEPEEPRFIDNKNRADESAQVKKSTLEMRLTTFRLRACLQRRSRLRRRRSKRQPAVANESFSKSLPPPIRLLPAHASIRMNDSSLPRQHLDQLRNRTAGNQGRNGHEDTRELLKRRSTQPFFRQPGFGLLIGAVHGIRCQ